MKKILFFLFLIGSFGLSAQNQWNIVGESVRLSPTPESDSTFVLAAPSLAALRQGQANWTASTPSYKVYTALLTQTGTNAPTATVLENTLGGTVVWTRDQAGIYSGTLANAFPATKTLIPFSTDGQTFCQIILNDDQTWTGKTYCLSRLSDSVIKFITTSADGNPSDEIYENAIYPIQITVYN